MRTLTPKEANATITESGKLNKRLFTPYTNTAQAIAALEAWVNSGSSPRAVAIYCNIQWSCNLTFEGNVCATDKDLSKAIVTALCSAIKGEQVEIKEVE